VKFHAKKIEAAAMVDGEESLRYIQCDIDESTGRPVAMLFWPTDTDGNCTCHPLDAQNLTPTAEAGLSYIYTGDPIPIPKSLAEMRPAPLSGDGFRLGFFFLPDSPADAG
jgi:hypothetical protein